MIMRKTKDQGTPEPRVPAEGLVRDIQFAARGGCAAKEDGSFS